MASRTQITANKARVFLLRIATGTSPTTSSPAAALRSAGITTNGEVTIFIGSGIFDSNNTCLAQVQAAALAGGAFIEAEIISAAGDRHISMWSVQAFTRYDRQDSCETFNVTLQSHGPCYYEAA